VLIELAKNLLDDRPVDNDDDGDEVELI